MINKVKRYVACFLAVVMLVQMSAVSNASDTEGRTDTQEKGWYGTVEEGERYYIDETGQKAVGVIEIDDKFYCFDEIGWMKTGWVENNNNKFYFSLLTGERYQNGTYTIDGEDCYFDEEGCFREDVKEEDAQEAMKTPEEVQAADSQQSIQESSTAVLKGWQTIDGKKYYYMPDGSVHKGWLSFGMTRYYCDSTGAVVTGMQSIEGEKYFFDADGILQYGRWIEKDGGKYYAMPDGHLQKGWLSFGMTRYYCDSTGAMVTGPYAIGGIVYYFNKKGILEPAPGGWQIIDGKKYYGMPDGYFRVGWLSFGNIRYYCDSTGAVATGIRTIGGKHYYFDDNGELQYGHWVNVDGRKYYAMPDGSFRVGWLSFGNIRYYCDSSGAIVTGPYGVDGISCYFDSEGKMTAAPAGWQIIDGKKYYGMPDGYFRVGWLSFGNIRYYCGTSGAVVTGMQTIGRSRYYFDEAGILKYGQWLNIDGQKYYAMPDGSFRVGWLSFGPIRYYCGSSGAIVKGMHAIGTYRYYFDETGVLQYNRWLNVDGRKYYAMPDGSLRVGWLSFGGIYYYCDSTGAVVTGDYPVDGILYTFNSDGTMQKKSGWGKYNGNTYFFNPSTGFPYRSCWVTFGDRYYYADGRGIMVKGWQAIGVSYYYFYPDSCIMARNTVIDGYYIGMDGKRLPAGLSEMTRKAQGYYSPTGYLLMVNRDTRKVGIFTGSSGNWNNLFYWDCTVGKPSTPTVGGTFHVGSKGYYFDSFGSRCFYYTQFYGDYLFHTVLCYKDGSIMDGRLGMALSHGCVRLAVPNAKWIYDYIPSGTTVVVY